MKAPRRKKKKDGTEFIGDFQTSKMHSPHKKMRTYILSDEIELSKSIHTHTRDLAYTTDACQIDISLQIATQYRKVQRET